MTGKPRPVGVSSEVFCAVPGTMGVTGVVVTLARSFGNSGVGNGGGGSGCRDACPDVELDPASDVRDDTDGRVTVDARDLAVDSRGALPEAFELDPDA